MKYTGKVITNFGGNLDVLLNNSEKVSCVIRSHLKGELTVGDNVNIDKLDNTYVITDFLHRRNLISRPNMYQRKNKNIVANIDQAAVVIAHSPEPVEHYIDRYLAALFISNIEPIIIINKVDSQNESDKLNMQTIYDRYSKIGYSIFFTSAKNDIGMDALKEALKHKTSIFIGQSGVGKSEILNNIIGNQITATGLISESTKKGKHTTTCSTLYHIDSDTNIIDSPGIREFGLWHITKIQLFDGFLDFKKYRGLCQFRNCAHEENSKGCEIVRQVKEGNIDPLRFKNYHRIIQEIKE